MESITLIPYILVSILWGIYAGRQQIKIYGGTKAKIMTVATVNVLFCPVAIIIAIVKNK